VIHERIEDHSAILKHKHARRNRERRGIAMQAAEGASVTRIRNTDAADAAYRYSGAFDHEARHMTRTSQ